MTASRPPRPVPGTAAYAGAVLTAQRLNRCWSQQRLIHHMRHLASGPGGRVLPDDENLRKMVSKWEHGKKKPGGYYRALLCAALEIPVSALGLPPVVTAFRPFRPPPGPTAPGPAYGTVSQIRPGHDRQGPGRTREDPYPRAA